MENTTESPAARAYRWGAEINALVGDELQNAHLDNCIVWMLDNYDPHTTIRTIKTLVAGCKVQPDATLLPSFERFHESAGHIMLQVINRSDRNNIPEFMTCYPKE